MTRLIDLGEGKQVVVTTDPRSDGTWLQLCANKGSLGLQLTKKQAMALRKALFEAVYG